MGYIQAVEQDLGSFKTIVGGVGGKLNLLQGMLTELQAKQTHAAGTTTRVTREGPENAVVRHEESRRVLPLEGAHQMKPATFDGKSDWDAYRTQFELLSRMNRWSEYDQAAHLAISLRGSAAMVLTNSPPRGYSYETLVTTLESRFGSAHQTEL